MILFPGAHFLFRNKSKTLFFLRIQLKLLKAENETHLFSHG